MYELQWDRVAQTTSHLTNNCCGKSVTDLKWYFIQNVPLTILNVILRFTGVYWCVWHFTAYNGVLYCIDGKWICVWMDLDLRIRVFEKTPHSTLAVNATLLKSRQSAVGSYLWRNSFQAFHYSSSFLRISNKSRGGGRDGNLMQSCTRYSPFLHILCEDLIERGNMTSILFEASRNACIYSCLSELVFGFPFLFFFFL